MISRDPLTTMALRFLLPMTAPSPHLAAAPPCSLMMDAIRTRFSPAGPIQATETSRPWSAIRDRIDLEVPNPHRSFAFLRSTESSSTEMYTGFSDLPFITIPSYPANFRSAPHHAPELASPQIPVRGEIAETAHFPDIGRSVPVKGPLAKTRRLLGERGSMTSGT